MSVGDSPIRPCDAAMKRGLDVTVAAVGLAASSGVIAAAWLACWLQTGETGFFRQVRIGRHGEPFDAIKLRTMRSDTARGTVTTADDPRITPIGKWLRRYKIDELPQLINVLKGDMSLVGPRPDVPGFADALEGEDRIILTIRPGITGPATLHYRDEEDLLAQADDPVTYNRDIIWPHKVALNKEYVENYRFVDDLGYLVRTVTQSLFHRG